MATSPISSYSSSNYAKIDATKVKANSPYFKPGTIEINGVKVKIARGDSLQKIVEKINTLKGKTGVEASIQETAQGQKIVLASKNSVVNITDHDRVMLHLHKSKKLGVKNECQIQCVGDKANKTVKVNYKLAGKTEQTNDLLEQYKSLLYDFKRNSSGVSPHGNSTAQIQGIAKVILANLPQPLFTAAAIGGADLIPDPVPQGMVGKVANPVVNQPLPTPAAIGGADLIPDPVPQGMVGKVANPVVNQPLPTPAAIGGAEFIYHLGDAISLARQQILAQQQITDNSRQQLLPAQQQATLLTQTVAAAAREVQQTLLARQQAAQRAAGFTEGLCKNVVLESIEVCLQKICSFANNMPEPRKIDLMEQVYPSIQALVNRVGREDAIVDMLYQAKGSLHNRNDIDEGNICIVIGRIIQEEGYISGPFSRTMNITDEGIQGVIAKINALGRNTL